MWPLEDPSPEEDLPSDVTFGSWLLSLEIEVVLLHIRERVRPPERFTLAYLLSKVLRSDHPQSDLADDRPDPGPGDD